MIDPKKIPSYELGLAIMAAYADMVNQPMVLIKNLMTDDLYGPRAKGIFREITHANFEAIMTFETQPHQEQVNKMVTQMQQLNNLVGEFLIDRTAELAYAMAAIPQAELVQTIEKDDPEYAKAIEESGVPDALKAIVVAAKPHPDLQRILAAATAAVGSQEEFAHLQAEVVVELPTTLGAHERTILQMTGAFTRAFDLQRHEAGIVTHAIHATLQSMRLLRDMAILPSLLGYHAAPADLVAYYFDNSKRIANEIAATNLEAILKDAGVAEFDTKKPTHDAPSSIN